MTIKHELDTIVEKWNLLEHPFYQAWSAGTLPLEALQVYAGAYGEFISALPRGWETLDDVETVQEELEHAGMWEDFKSALGEAKATYDIREPRALVQAADELFASRAAALGALYAFEVQQPRTAVSKLDGLRRHYDFPSQVEPYFIAHSVNWHESEKLLEQINALTPADQLIAQQACARMAQALWDALSGIHEGVCRN